MARKVIQDALKAELSRTLCDVCFDESVLSLITRKAYSLEIEALASQYLRPWSISQELGCFLISVIMELGCQNILEFGAGSSSVILAHGLSLSNGGKLTSIEQNPGWCHRNWQIVKELENVDSHLIEATPTLTVSTMGLYFFFKEAVSKVSKRSYYDLVLIDSPQFFFGRDGAIPLVYNYLAPNALVVLDDAGRYGESWSIYRWIHSYPGLKLVYYNPEYGGKGLAVLRFVEKVSPRFSPIGFATSIRQMLYILSDQHFRNLRSQKPN